MIHSENFRLTASAKPSGGEWHWEIAAPGVQASTDIELTGLRYAPGAEKQVAKSHWLRFEGGLETNREITISLTSDPSTTATVDLENSWFAGLGFLAAF